MRTLLVTMMVAFGGPALAQSAPPIGLWVGEAAGDAILVQSDGNCSTSGSMVLSGQCSWDGTSTGGVLTLNYQWTAGPAAIYYSIRWVDQDTLLVNEVERFHRQG